ncbi:MAG: arylsulfatase A-like enzyme [Myxococcota bacterium]|jgi:arylsulfatase A-like enzyme
MKHLWRALFTLTGAAILGGLWSVGFILPPDPEAVSGVDPASIDAALRSDPEVPLSVGQTDVLLIIACTLRRDRLEPYGHTRPTSPFLDRLSDSGVRFDSHFAQAPWTRPSVGSIITGRWPRILQLDNPGRRGTLSLVLQASQTTLAEVLSGEGYRTFSATGNPNIKDVFGFQQGVEAFVEPEGQWSEGGTHTDDAELVDATLNFANTLAPDERLFARVVLTGAHLPRQIAWRDRGLFTGSKKTLIDPYDTALRRLDAQIARLVTGLSDRNLLVVVVADHGEGLNLPTHHGTGHGNHLYPSTVAVPLLLHHPSFPSGHVVSGLSMNIDLHPTLLSLLGVTRQHPVDGADLSSAVLGEPETGNPRVFAETFYRKAKKSAVADETHLLIRDNRRKTDTLYARSDPGATQPLSDPMLAARLGSVLTAWESDRAASITRQPQEVELSEETRRQLEVMGDLE